MRWTSRTCLYVGFLALVLIRKWVGIFGGFCLRFISYSTRRLKETDLNGRTSVPARLLLRLFLIYLPQQPHDLSVILHQECDLGLGFPGCWCSSCFRGGSETERCAGRTCSACWEDGGGLEECCILADYLVYWTRKQMPAYCCCCWCPKSFLRLLLQSRMRSTAANKEHCIFPISRLMKSDFCRLDKQIK